jgi:transposase
MYGWESHVLLRHYLEQQYTVTAIASELGCDRRTIQRWIAAGELDRDPREARYGPRAPVPTKLDPHKTLIRERLDTYPLLTAVRLFEEVRAGGYTGSLTQLKAFVRQVRPVPEPEPPNRFETEPGVQAQVDFADVRLPWGKRYALMVVLGYSRLLWVQFYPRQTMRILMRGLEEAFHFLRGVPRELLFDQLRAVIVDDQRPLGGKVIENPEFLRFAAHWHFRIRACRPGRAKTKGKVERPIRYLRQSFLYARDFAGDADLNAQVLHWLATVANVRVHATTQEQPIARYERDERAVLQPLAARPYRSLVLLPDAPRTADVICSVPRIAVEQRPLTAYAQLAGGDQ